MTKKYNAGEFIMRKSYLFLLFLAFGVFACIAHFSRIELPVTEATIDPHVPTDEITRESRIESLQNTITKLSGIYQKMNTFTEQNPDFKKGIKKASKIESTYGKRITEITSLTLTDLTDDELETLSFEVSKIFSAIREVNDLFEFQ